MIVNLKRDKPHWAARKIRKIANISAVLAGQKLGIREVDDGTWLVSFMQYGL